MEPPLPLPKPPVCTPNLAGTQKDSAKRTREADPPIQQLVGDRQLIANCEALKVALSVQAGGETSVPDLSKQYPGLCTFDFKYSPLYLNMDKF